MVVRTSFRALDALEALSRRPFTPAELARELNTTRSTSLRLIQSLLTEGWVTRHDGRRYTAGGPRLWALLQSPPDQLRVRAVADPLLAEMRDSFHEATTFAVRAGDAMVYTSYFAAPQDFGILERLGSARPMHCSALGKAYLSALAPAELEHELKHLSYTEGTSQAPHTAAELRREVGLSSERGFALDLGETVESAHCVAIPVRFSGTLWGAAGVQGPAERLSEARLTEIGQELIRRFGPFDRLASAGLSPTGA